MGNRNLRKLLIVGAHAVLFHHKAIYRPAADVGEEADREGGLQARRRGACQQHGAHRVRDHARQDGLPGNSGVRASLEFAAGARWKIQWMGQIGRS
jgi:hypothetical protein